MKTTPNSNPPDNLIPLPAPQNQAASRSPETAAQQRQRAILAAVASHWRRLTPDQRDTWCALAPQLPDRPSGFAAFNQVNATLLTLGRELLEVAPNLPTFGLLTFGSFTALHAAAPPHALTLSLPLENSRLPDGYLYEATRPLSPGVSNPGTAFRLLAAVSGPVPLSPDRLTRAYLERFGDPPDGEALFLRVTPVTHGLRGVPFTFTTIVARASAPGAL